MTTTLDRVRALCHALPEVIDKVSHGGPTWFVGGVLVAALDA